MKNRLAGKGGCGHRRLDRLGFGHSETVRPGRDGSCLHNRRRKEALDRAVAEIGKNVTAVQGDVGSLTDLGRP